MEVWTCGVWGEAVEESGSGKDETGTGTFLTHGPSSHFSPEEPAPPSNLKAANIGTHRLHPEWYKGHKKSE